MFKKVFQVFGCVLLGSCVPMTYPSMNTDYLPKLDDFAFSTIDGARLPIHTWLPTQGNPSAAIIALHGFNDYGNFFSEPGQFISRAGIACYAYDQRGFGSAPNRGLWAGTETYANDLTQIVSLVRDRHPGIPVFLLGESMGGAVVIATVTRAYPPDVDGIILAAPAVWGRATMPWYQRMILWLTSHTVPWMTVTGEGLDITPSDNIEMLRALSRDPLVIRETRIETIHGLVDLMDEAFNQSSEITLETLVLYGEKDDVIPKQPTYEMLKTIADNGIWKIALYENGYHMLLRDLQAEILWRDIVAWIRTRDVKLPSGADVRAESVLFDYEAARE